MAALVLHISREVIHHGSELCLLRDLYRTQPCRNRMEDVMIGKIQIAIDSQGPACPEPTSGPRPSGTTARTTTT